MFTSGSTGAPKGVTVPHRGVIDYAIWVAKTFNINENLYLEIKHRSILIIRYLIYTAVFWVPTVMINVANSGVLSEIELPKLKNVVFCGEVMPNTQLNIWRKAQPQCTYANLYGPTEISDVCTYYIVDRPFKDSDSLPIGKACENMRIIILNEKNEIAKTNEQGEICVIGTGVSLGYWNNPEITQKAFIQNPVNPYYEERIYRTGLPNAAGNLTVKIKRHLFKIPLIRIMRKEFIVQAIWHM